MNKIGAIFRCIKCPWEGEDARYHPGKTIPLQKMNKEGFVRYEYLEESGTHVCPECGAPAEEKVPASERAKEAEPGFLPSQE